MLATTPSQGLAEGPRGERIGLFSYNNSDEAGYADFGSFTYRYDSSLTR